MSTNSEQHLAARTRSELELLSSVQTTILSGKDEKFAVLDRVPLSEFQRLSVAEGFYAKYNPSEYVPHALLAVGHQSLIAVVERPGTHEERYGDNIRQRNRGLPLQGVISLTSDGPTAYHEIIVDAPPLSIGRSTENHWPLPFDDQVSKRHLSIGWFGSTLLVQDHGSSNGTLIAQEHIGEPPAAEPARKLWLVQ